MSKIGSRGFDNWHRCGKSFRRCFDNCQSLERVHDTVRQSLSGRHVSHLTSGRCAFSYVLTSYISLMPLQVRGAEKDDNEKKQSMLTKRANPIELYNQQNIHFAIKHFKLQIYLIAQIKLWSTRSELLATKMSLLSTLCVYACMYMCIVQIQEPMCYLYSLVIVTVSASRKFFVYLQNQLVSLIFAKVLASFFFFAQVLTSWSYFLQCKFVIKQLDFKTQHFPSRNQIG